MCVCVCVCVSVCAHAQSCPALCNLMDYSPLGFSVRGISLAENTEAGDFPGDPVAEIQEAWVRSLAQELDPMCCN